MVSLGYVRLQLRNQLRTDVSRKSVDHRLGREVWDAGRRRGSPSLYSRPPVGDEGLPEKTHFPGSSPGSRGVSLRERWLGTGRALPRHLPPSLSKTTREPPQSHSGAGSREEWGNQDVEKTKSSPATGSKQRHGGSHVQRNGAVCLANNHYLE